MATVRNWFLVVGGALVALGLTAHSARADYVSSDTRVPSPTYRSSTPVVYGGQYVIDSFFDIFTEIQRTAGPPEGPPRIDSFFDVFTEIDLHALGTPPQLRESPSRPTIKYTRLNGLPPGTPVFDTEMLQLDISGGSLPAGVMIRESPTLASTGKTTITDNGGGLYRIDSFFDVFTELSIDGGQTWMPGSAAMHLDGGLPEPSTLLLSVIGLFGGAATMFRRARRR